MSLSFMFLTALALALFAFLMGRRKALAFAGGGLGGRSIGAVHSRPHFHGAYVALFAQLPALLLLIAWGLQSERVITDHVISTLPAEAQPKSGLDRDAFMAEVRGLATGEQESAFDPNAEGAAKTYVATRARYNAVAGLSALALALAGAGWAWTRLRPDFRARNKVERAVMAALVIASLVATLTTFGIVVSLIFESFRFFQMVPATEFLFGTQWSPQTAIRADQVGGSGAFGAVPLFWGTVFIGAIIAMIVAIRLG